MVLWFFLLAIVAPADSEVVEVGASGNVRAEHKPPPIRLSSYRSQAPISAAQVPTHETKVKEDIKPRDDFEVDASVPTSLDEKSGPQCPTDKPSSSPDAPISKTVRVLSDFHAGGCWFRDPVVQDQLMTLLENMGNGQDPVDELVLLGDTFEFHLAPINEPQPHPKTLFTSTNASGFNMVRFTSLIQQISQRTQTYFIVGNHDEEANREMVKLAFGPCVKHMGYGFTKYGIWFEHGHNADLWNRMHLGEENRPLLPWGYYVTRASYMGRLFCAGGMPQHRGQPRAVMQELADWFETKVFPQEPKAIDDIGLKYMQSRWESNLLLIIGNAMDQEFTSPEDLKAYPVVGADAYNIRWDDETSNFTLYDAFEAHRNEFRTAVEKLSHGGSIAMVHAMMQDFSKWASRDTKHDIVIAGHTHRPILSEVKRAKDPKNKKLREKVVYVNSGGWVASMTGETSRTYVDFTVTRRSAPVQESKVVRKASGDADPHEWKAHRVEIVQFPANSLYTMDLS